MRLGRYFVRLGWTMYPVWVLHYTDGRRYPELLTRIEGETVTLGRGGVLTLGPVMLWWTRDARIRGLT